MDCSLLGSSVHGILQAKNTGVGSHSFLQEIFPTQGLSPDLLHCRQILYCLSHQGRLYTTYYKLQALLCMHAQSCQILCDLMVGGLPGFSVNGILQARILEWVAIFCSRGSSWPTDWSCISCDSCNSRQFLYHCAIWEASNYKLVSVICILIKCQFNSLFGHMNRDTTDHFQELSKIVH